MTELDKFKRRMIRAVARLLQEKKAEDELWDQMKKETGCDCRLLWERMRALTLKKLRRLLLSDDKSENVASIARMSLTDWLLFDLVLVHEKIDFIERDVLESNKEMKPLIELFYLVQKFQIESLRSNALADAWTAATVIYNSRGHQCSPMLLQRRWYQLKETTRERFYRFWFKYRGNARQLSSAGQFMPSRLQAAIAKRYKDLITKPFLDWDKMIDERLVILPDEFESKMRNINFKMPLDSDDPELILVEPIIETIDLGADSDSDQQEESSPTDPQSKTEMPPLIKIKSEPKDTTINDDDNASCDAEILRAMNKQLPQKVLDATSIEEKALLESENETLNALLNKSITTDTVDIVVDAVGNDVSETSEVTNANDVIMPQISKVFGNVTCESLSLLTAQTETEVVSKQIELKTKCLNTLEDSYPVENNTNTESEDSALQRILPEAEQIVPNDTDKNNLVSLIINSSDDDIGIRGDDDHSNEVTNETEDTTINHDTNVESENAVIGHLENEVVGTYQNTGSLMTADASRNVKVEVEDVINLDKDKSDPPIRFNNLNENTVTIEHADDALENLDNFEDDIICIPSEDILTKPKEMQDPVVKVEEIPVDINFADDGIEFVDDGIEFIDEDDDSNSYDENIKRHLPIKYEADDQTEKGDEETPKFDLKLLLNPIVYTKKLNDLSIFTDNVFDVKSKDLIDYIEKECKPLCVMSNDVTNIKQEIQEAIATSANDDLLNNDSSEESDFEDIPESYKVKTSSYLLQKPKSRTYNPIQLCKNPDFNTRLKRLPVGFFSSTRNCQLLKSCKPMTIDVNKKFEDKLINGTIYLKSNSVSDSVVNYVEEEKDTESKQTVSVLPSAMAAQSLIDNTIVLPASKQMNILTDYIRPILANNSNDNTLISERSRVINLPDISQIRRINQKLQTAEVTPIRVQHVQHDPSNTAVHLVTNIDRVVETNAPGVQLIQPNVSEVINVPDKPASVVIEEDKKPLIIPDQNQTIIPSKESSNASKIKDFIKQIEATGSEISKADPKLDIMSSQVNDKMSKEKNLKLKNAPNKYNKRSYPEVSWLSAKRQPIINNDDSLLTLDTLNKMLNIINGDVVVDKDGQFQINKKKKKNASKPLLCKDSKLEGLPSKSKKSEKVSRKSKDEHIIEKMRKAKKPKIKIIAGNRKDDLPQKTQDHCCCRKPLLEYQTKQNAACVVLSDDDDNTALHNACESIERVVRQTHEVDPKTASVSVVQAKILNAEKQTNPLDEVEIPVEIIATPAIEIEVKSSPTEGVESLDIQISDRNTQTENILGPPIANIKINELIGSDVASVVETTVAPALSGSTMKDDDKIGVAEAMPLSKPKKLIKHTVNIQTSVTNSKSDYFVPNQSIQVDTFQVKRKYTNTRRTVKRVLPESFYQSISDEGARRPRREKNVLYKYQAMPCSCRLPSVSLDTPKRHIIIDGSTSCALHNKTSTNIKHKLLLMNSKNISKEPTERPISLGKNKILLTTVKLPKHTQPSPEQFQNPQVIPALPLPSGVQLILLPTGELTYFVEPTVQLNAEQMSTIPIIIAAVKQQLDTCTVPPTPVPGVVMNNDIVNISDDESAPSNNTNNVDVKSHIEKHTINEEFVKKLNDSYDNLNENTNKKGNNVDETLNLNINKERNDGNHLKENINKLTVGVGDPNVNVSTETNNVDDNLNVNVNTQSNVQDNILNENVNKEKNVVGDLNENVNEEKKNVGDQIDNITTEDNAVDDSNDNINKIKNNVCLDPIENMDTETNVGDLKENFNEEKNDNIDKEHNDSESASSSTATRKTILSDLMEMSGISAEDTVSTSQQNIINENIEGTVTENLTLPNMLEHTVLPISPLVPLSNIIHETDVDAGNIPELTPITSLSELKYACEQEDGQFFKLDLDTGILIPINVCIKKHTKHSSPLDTNTLVKPIAPKQVMIDLTDDNDIIVQENPSSKPMMYNNVLSRNNYKSLLKSSQGDSSIKPIKIFKSVHANILRKRYRNNLTESKICVELDKKKYRKRKQRLSQIEAKIDLVDSDAPMEEEYLMDSSDDSQNSSDDEPLAAIAKRKRAENTVTNANESDKVDGKSNVESNAHLKDTSDKSEILMDTSDVALDRPEAGNNNADPTDITAVTEVRSAVAPDVTDAYYTPDIVSEKGSSQVPCDNDVDEPPQISFLSDDNYDSDESQENCILGV